MASGTAEYSAEYSVPLVLFARGTVESPQTHREKSRWTHTCNYPLCRDVNMCVNASMIGEM